MSTPLLSLPARAALARLSRGAGEVVLVLAVYVGYSATRLLADGTFGPAVARAKELLSIERVLGLDLESWLNGWFVTSPGVGLAGSFYYASAHYLVTGVALVWLWRRGPAMYVPARRALLLGTAMALVLYILFPMAPPRLIDDYVDVLRLSAAHGWWGGDASAPRGLGGYTNQLAAFPSMHAGWALWVAWVVQREVRRPWVRALVWTHVALTALVIVGTGNHWVLDAVAGWVVVGAALGITATLPAVPGRDARLPGRWWSTSGAGSLGGTTRSER